MGCAPGWRPAGIKKSGHARSPGCGVFLHILRQVAAAMIYVRFLAVFAAPRLSGSGPGTKNKKMPKKNSLADVRTTVSLRQIKFKKKL